MDSVCSHSHLSISTYQKEPKLPAVRDALYATGDNIDGNISSLENASNVLLKWLSENVFKGNANKCHLLVNVKDEVSLKVGDFNVANSA